MRFQDRDFRPREMVTYFGVRMGFELRTVTHVKNSRNSSKRRAYVIAYPDREGHSATVEEKRLWAALPRKMRGRWEDFEP